MPNTYQRTNTRSLSFNLHKLEFQRIKKISSLLLVSCQSAHQFQSQTDLVQILTWAFPHKLYNFSKPQYMGCCKDLNICKMLSIVQYLAHKKFSLMLVIANSTSNNFLLTIDFQSHGFCLQATEASSGIKLQREMLLKLCPASGGKGERGASFTRMFLS